MCFSVSVSKAMCSCVLSECVSVSVSKSMCSCVLSNVFQFKFQSPCALVFCLMCFSSVSKSMCSCVLSHVFKFLFMYFSFSNVFQFVMCCRWWARWARTLLTHNDIQTTTSSVFILLCLRPHNDIRNTTCIQSYCCLNFYSFVFETHNDIRTTTCIQTIVVSIFILLCLRPHNDIRTTTCMQSSCCLNFYSFVFETAQWYSHHNMCSKLLCFLNIYNHVTLFFFIQSASLFSVLQLQNPKNTLFNSKKLYLFQNGRFFEL